MDTKSAPISLAEALPQEQARCRQLLTEYQRIGAAGMFGAALIEAALRAADVAASGGDVVAMLVAYNNLKSLE